jgi:(p)ppGpp synthase/HD superfamily hydrolase
MSDLERAIEIAASAHRGDVDKAGQPYILHPLSLMLQFHDLDAMMVAVLHDTVEDSALTLGDLDEEGFSGTVVAAVDALTRREDESYDDFISRLASDPLARRVKLADLEHNLDVRRIGSLQPSDLERLDRYHRAWLVLRKRDGGPTGPSEAPDA